MGPLARLFPKHRPQAPGVSRASLDSAAGGGVRWHPAGVLAASGLGAACHSLALRFWERVHVMQRLDALHVSIWLLDRDVAARERERENERERERANIVCKCLPCCPIGCLSSLN